MCCLKATAATCFANDTNFRPDLFVRDTVAGTTTLVNVNQAGTAPGNDYVGNSALSSNGRYVTFTSAATDLVAAGKQVSIYDVFVRDLQTSVTTLLTTIYGGSVGGNKQFL